MDIFLWRYTDILNVGFERTLLISDLPELPKELTSEYTHLELISSASDIYVKDKSRFCCSFFNGPLWCLTRTLLDAYGGEFIFLGFLKLVACLLSFVGPVLLNRIVSLVENDPSHNDLFTGLILVAVLFLGLALQSLVGAHSNIYAAFLQAKVRGSLTRAVFSRAMALPAHSLKAMGISEGEVSNMVQIDVSKISDVIGSLHDLWNLPLLLILAFVLLYFQVKIAFLAGVAIIVIMIPINSWIAKEIGSATSKLMVEKDKRVNYISEAIRGMKSIKMLCLESIVYDTSLSIRKEEMKYLSIRKYLDAVCVFLWASLPILVPFFTFLTTVEIGESLTASEVFTTIALLNMLIFPMNAFPWVVNGVVEASVSARRLLKLLYSNDGHDVFDGDVILSDSSTIVHEYDADHEVHHHAAAVGRLHVDRHHAFLGRALINVDSSNGRESFVSPGTVYALNSAGNFVYTSVHFVYLKHVLATWTVDKIDSANHNDIEPSFRSTTAKQDFVLGPLTTSLPVLTISTKTANKKGSLENVNRDFLVCVCGAVGSGKSMLLMSILRETNLRSGKIRFMTVADIDTCISRSKRDKDRLKLDATNRYIEKENISYCPQVPGMYAGSMKFNITLSLPNKNNEKYLKRRYNMIFEGCCLSREFYNDDITMPYERQGRLSDLTDVGQNGNRLSGGQRLRVGLARALYANTPIVVLDDPFSALDDATANSILLFLKSFSAREQRMIVFSTHKIHLLSSFVDRMILLSAGRCQAIGTYNELSEQEAYRALLEDGGEHRAGNGEADHNSKEQLNVSNILSDEDNDKETAAALSVEAESEREDRVYEMESSQAGRIVVYVYKQYLNVAGASLVFVIILSTFMMQTTAILMQYWLAYWVANTKSVSDNRFVTVFGLIAAANVFFALIRSFSFAKAGLDAARLLYERVTRAVLFTSLHFFETTSLGRIINRFGKETERIDDNLPFVANIVLAQFFSFAGAIVIISISNYLMIGIILISLVRYYFLQKFYRASSREVRRLESSYRSPMYTLISDCLGDTVALRSCPEMLANLENMVANALNDSLKVMLMSCYCSQWLNIRLQMLGAAITAAVGLLAVVCSIYGVVDISPGLFGLALALSFSLVRNLNGLVSAVTETEQEMISVERVCEYCCLSCEFREKEVNLMTKTVDKKDQDWCCCFSSVKTQLAEDEESKSSRSSFGSAGTLMSSELIKAILLTQTTSSVNEKAPLLQREQNTALSFFESGKPFVPSIAFRGFSLSYSNFDDMFDNSTVLGELCNSREEEVSSPSLVSRYALADINFDIPAGSRVALLGHTGSGKTSLFRALLGINQYGGSLEFGGVEIRDIPRSLLRGNLVGIIPQDPFLFSGTIRNNLDPFGQFNEKQLVFAIEKCGILSTMHSRSQLSSISESCVDELNVDVSALSTGQKQLICLARCILRDAKLVLIDEATSSLDPMAESNLFKVLISSVPTMTTVMIICHNPAAVTPYCDVIVELEYGSVKKFEKCDVCEV